MKKTLKIILYTAIVISAGWGGLTLYVEKSGPEKHWDFGEQSSNERVLIVYDPDPFNNFDEKVCIAFAEVLAENNMTVKVVSVSSAVEVDSESYDVFVFCANTYNWAPDWALRGYIQKQKSIENKPVIAITLGAGSTNRSKKILEKIIATRQGKLIDSRTLWLLRPNDEMRLEESNVQVALSATRTWANSIVKVIHEKD